jgi:Holliday junction resolvasome RuvABC ATP-dependent DNA helicase subunit
MKLDIRKIFNKHFGVDDEEPTVTRDAPTGLNKIQGFDDLKKVVRAAMYGNKSSGVLFVGPPASAKTMFLEGIIEEAGEGLYFDGTNTTNKILTILEQERPRIVCIDEIEKMPRNFQEKLLSLCESGHVKVDQKNFQCDFKIEGLKIFAAANDTKRLSKPLTSRFLTLTLPGLTEKEFIETAEKLAPQLGTTAGFIAKCVLAQKGDMRMFRRLADFVQVDWSEQDVLELVETTNKYSERVNEE